MTYYTVYKTVNLLNGKFYFGVHKTKDPYDNYLGSGTYIKRAAAKYGEQNFRKEVLFIYLDAESAFGKEDELIQCWRSNPLCMNLRKGGSGGFDWINREGKSVVGRRQGLKVIQQMLTDGTMRSVVLENLKKAEAAWLLNPEGRRESKLKGTKAGTSIWRGQKHSIETRKTLRDLRLGDLNPRFGTHWVTDGMSNRVIKGDDPIPIGWRRGRVLQKV